jgi:hypothetical protein
MLIYFISYSLVCGKVLLKIYEMGHKIAELKRENKIAEMSCIFAERGNTHF